MILFPTYLDDMESYQACESFWLDVFQTILLASDEALPDWRDEEGRAEKIGGLQLEPFAAAKRFGGISPMLWKISPSSRRGISLTHSVQGENSTKPYLEAKMDAHDWLHYDRLDTLRIHTMPSEKELIVITMLISTWVARNTSLDGMKGIVDRLCREGKASR